MTILMSEIDDTVRERFIKRCEEDCDGMSDVVMGDKTDGACSGKWAGQLQNMVSETVDDEDADVKELRGMWVRAWIWVATESVEEALK